MPSESAVDSPSKRSLGFASLKALFMFDLTFSLLEGGLPQQGRVVVLFRFTTPSRIVRSGMLNFDQAERRFVGPQRNQELIDAALEFMHSVEPGATLPREQTA